MNSPYMTTPSSSQGARIVGEGLSDTSGPGPELMTAATLTGNTVVNTADETLGKIEEIMLDVPGGRIAYAVMSSGGFLGLGEKLFAIPWGALTLDTNRECFVLDARAETFENAITAQPTGAMPTVLPSIPSSSMHSATRRWIIP